MNFATCHPEKKHKAHGLCMACYSRHNLAKKGITVIPLDAYTAEMRSAASAKGVAIRLEKNASRLPIDPSGKRINCHRCRKTAFYQATREQYFCAYCRWVGTEQPKGACTK